MSALAGVRVLELSGERIAFAGKLLADMGADVILIEPPGDDPARNLPPFADDQPGPERSLWWWHYQTSKRGVTLDLETPEGQARFRDLAAGADILLESEPAGRLGALGLDYEDLKATCPGLVFVSMTPFGRTSANAAVPATDLTLLAGAGPAWSCGYDDHSLPPVRGGGGQGYHTGCHFAAMSALTAYYWKLGSGEGQLVDVSMHQASNVTTEAASYTWLVAGQTVQRQTGRHAATVLTQDTQVMCRDGRWVNTGVAARMPREYAAIHSWIVDLNLQEAFPEVVFLEMGANMETPLTYDRIGTDPEATAIFMAGRDALGVIAAAVDADAFFTGFQSRGFPVGAIYSPEEAFENDHFKARGFQTPLAHADGTTVVYPGAPYKFSATPWALSRPAPKLGEHNRDILGT